jgi:hypothetical protein
VPRGGPGWKVLDRKTVSVDGYVYYGYHKPMISDYVYFRVQGETLKLPKGIDFERVVFKIRQSLLTQRAL